MLKLPFVLTAIKEYQELVTYQAELVLTNTLWLFMVVMITFSFYYALGQVCSLMYPQLVLGAHGNPRGLPCCLLCCR